MTSSKEGSRDCLKYKLEGCEDLEIWGYEYVRYLAGEVGEEYQKRTENPEELPDMKDLQALIDKIIPYMINSNAEPDACDLLYEVEQLKMITKFCDKTNYSRVCLYLSNMANYLLEDEKISMLTFVYQIYRDLEKFPEALRVAIQMNNSKMIEDTFNGCKDKTLQKQMAFMLAKVHFPLESDDGDIQEIIQNNFLSQHFLHLAKDLDALEPKTPEEIYKTHLTDSRSSIPQNVDSARKNLASTFVNAFVNAGYTKDKLITLEGGSAWVYKNKDTGMLSAAASLGLIYLWNLEEGLNQVDKYLYTGDDNIKAGAILAQGIINCGIHNNFAKDLLEGHIEGNSRIIRIAAILGLGISYAGTANKEIFELLAPIISDSEENIEVVSFASLALGMIFVGTSNEDISGTIISVLFERDPKVLGDTLVRFLCLGLGLLFLGKGDAADAILQTSKTLNSVISSYCEITVLTCAYAGTGNVLKVQQLLKICGEHIKDEKISKSHQAVAVLGIAMIAMGEELGSKMALRSLDHLLQYCDIVGKRAVPLALGLLSISNPQMNVMDTLSKLSHDSDSEVAQSAVIGLGLIGAGTNNARIAQLLRQLSSYYSKDANILFTVRIAQGLLFMGKGLLSLSPFYSEKYLLSSSSMAGLLVFMHTCLDMKNLLLGKYHYLLYCLTPAMHPRMLLTLDEDLKPLPVSVRVGQAVDVVAQAGRPKTITGFQTHNTPVILGHEDRSELATSKYIPVTTILEGPVILKVNKDYKEE